jgi:hypothetical protein
MNGREISNAVNTAYTLAMSEERKLEIEHLNTIVDIWKKFEEDLTGRQSSNGA